MSLKSNKNRYVVAKSLRGHQGPVTVLAANERLLASGGDHQLYLWDFVDWQKDIWPFVAIQIWGEVTAIALTTLNRGGDMVAVGTGEGILTVYRIQGTPTLGVFNLVNKRNERDRIVDIAFNPGCDQIAACTAQGNIFCWRKSEDGNGVKFNLLWENNCHPYPPAGIGFQNSDETNEGVVIFLGYRSMTIVRWRLTGECGDCTMCVGSFKVGLPNGSLYTKLNLRPTGFYSITDGGIVQLWGMGDPISRTFEPKSKRPDGSICSSVSFSRDDKEAVMSSMFGDCHIFECESGEWVDTLELDGNSDHNSVNTTFERYGLRYIATARSPGRGEKVIHIWQPRTSRLGFQLWIFAIIVVAELCRIFMMRRTKPQWIDETNAQLM